MSVSTSNSSHARSRSLRVPVAGTLKPPSTTPSATGPSYVALFLSNLRLLDLDLREDWPDITSVTFSTKDLQQNQKRRIQCVEWALYQLFALWEPAETRDKLQPFFPPLEPLQSLNLRAALFRCLDSVKKIGVLGRDTVLRKTMLDECKGERLEEILAVFSNAVLKKVLLDKAEADGSIAMELVSENFSYHGERSILAAMILAHKFSLGKHLQGKDDDRAKLRDFEELLSLNQRRIVRREEQLKEIVKERGLEEQLLRGEVEKVQKTARGNWTGGELWLDEILNGDGVRQSKGLLATKFDKVWKHVERGRISELEAEGHTGLVEQLDARVKEQESRLARWKAFGRELEQRGPVSPSKKRATAEITPKGFDLGFNKHQKLHIGKLGSSQLPSDVPNLGDYAELIENMKRDLSDVGNSGKVAGTAAGPTRTWEGRKSPEAKSSKEAPLTIPEEEDDAWSSASDADNSLEENSSYKTKSVSRTPPSESLGLERQLTLNSNDIPPKQSAKQEDPMTSPQHTNYDEFRLLSKQRSISPLPLAYTPTPPPLDTSQSLHIRSHEAELADQILDTMAATSPSPKKRHTLSLAERTRLSMARTSHSKFADFNDEDEPADLPRLSIKSRPSLALKSPTEDPDSEKHADLIERTRKSMVGFEAAQKKAQIERRRSIKEEKKRQRQSSYFPKVEEEETPTRGRTMDVLAEDRDPDYEAVFQSRPRIATSPGF